MPFKLPNFFGKKKDETPVSPITSAQPPQSDMTTPEPAASASTDFGMSGTPSNDTVASTTPTAPVEPAMPVEPMIGNEVNSGIVPPVEPVAPPQSPAAELIGEPAPSAPVSQPLQEQAVPEASVVTQPLVQPDTTAAVPQPSATADDSTNSTDEPTQPLAQ